jgi:LacI family transcriptional regulator
LKRSTLLDVADAAGVAPSTVSRYLNGRMTLPETTAARIDAAAQELAYRPNEIARRLSLGRTNTIGFATADIAYSFFAAIAGAAEEEATKHGYDLLIFNTRNELSLELSYLSRIENQHIDGLLFMTNHADDGVLAGAVTRARNVVLIDEDVEGTRVGKVFADNVEGGFEATSHLIAQGHRRIAFVGGPRQLLSSSKRYAGYCAALAAASIEIDESLLQFGRYEEDFGFEAFQSLWRLPKPPTAIFATADMLAIGIIRAARQQGVGIPSRVSIVGFDDIGYADLLDPPLTTIRQSAAELGRQGVRLLLGILGGKRVPRAPIKVPVELVVRGSVSRKGSAAPASVASGPAAVLREG